MERQAKMVGVSLEAWTRMLLERGVWRYKKFGRAWWVKEFTGDMSFKDDPKVRKDLHFTTHKKK